MPAQHNSNDRPLKIEPLSAEVRVRETAREHAVEQTTIHEAQFDKSVKKIVIILNSQQSQVITKPNNLLFSKKH